MSVIVFSGFIESESIEFLHVNFVAHSLEIANGHIQRAMALAFLEFIRLVCAAVCYDSSKVVTLPEGEHLGGVGFSLHDH